MSREVLLITTSRGLMGNAFTALRSKRNFQFEIVFPEDFGLRIDALSIVQLLNKTAPDVILHNAAHVPRGISDFSFEEKAKRNFDLFSAIASQAVLRRVRVFSFLSSYQIFRPNNRPPFLNSGKHSVQVHNSDSSYIRQKKLEILKANEISKFLDKERTSLYGFVLPHMFGPGDKFHYAHAHFVAKMMYQIIESIERGDETFFSEGNLATRIQLAHSIDAADSILRSLALNADCNVLKMVDSGCNLTLQETLEEVLNVSGFTGKLVNIDSPLNLGQGHHDLYFSSASKFDDVDRFNLRMRLKETWQWFLNNRQVS